MSVKIKSVKDEHFTNESLRAICQHIETATDQAFDLQTAKSIAGGDINSAFCLQGTQHRYFVKLNRPQLAEMFAAEFAGLLEIADSQTIKVPEPIVYGQTSEHSYLVLEFIDFGTTTNSSSRQLGQQLAQLHLKSPAYFGWSRDNTIGSTPQINNKNSNWLDFWREHRLGFQLQLATKNGYTGKLQTQGQKLCQELDKFFDEQPKPSLLHGDLWGGNAAVDKQGHPVIFDPACYYGDRETDLAMTELFGGFSADFYAAYADEYPLKSGYKTRKKLYNLYHILNHLNLFGGGYLRQAESMIAQLLSEVA
jgi:fructosamine-3-kinase